MFDHHSKNSTSIKLTPEAATAEPAVRVVLGHEVHWIRPSNVLRLYASADAGGRPKYLTINFSDGEKIDFYTGGMSLASVHSLVDRVAAILWPQP